MKDYVWFQLVIRAIGVLTLALSLPHAIWTVLWGVGQAVSYQASMLGPGELFLSVIIAVVGSCLQVAVGVYLLFGGRALIAYCLARVGERCVACGYDVSALAGDVCPECGTPITGDLKSATISGSDSDDANENKDQPST